MRSRTSTQMSSGKNALRIHQRVVDGEMLFEPDLALHGVPPVSAAILCGPAKNESRPAGGFFEVFVLPSREAAKVGGARRNRTADLLNAIQALSQLSYGPIRESDRSSQPIAGR